MKKQNNRSTRSSHSGLRTGKFEKIHRSMIVSRDDGRRRRMSTIDMILLHVFRPDPIDIISHRTREERYSSFLKTFLPEPRPSVPNDLFYFFVVLHFFADRCSKDDGVIIHRCRLSRRNAQLRSCLAKRISLERIENWSTNPSVRLYLRCAWRNPRESTFLLRRDRRNQSKRCLPMPRDTSYSD